jgi:hypothetical protein
MSRGDVVQSGVHPVTNGKLDISLINDDGNEDERWGNEET